MVGEGEVAMVPLHFQARVEQGEAVMAQLYVLHSPAMAEEGEAPVVPRHSQAKVGQGEVGPWELPAAVRDLQLFSSLSLSAPLSPLLREVEVEEASVLWPVFWVAAAE